MITNLEEKLYQCDCKDVIVPEGRTRTEFDKKTIEQIAESIKKRRQDHPGICFLNEEGKPVLIAGEQRLRACELIQVPYTFRLQEEVDPIIILETELEENLCRKNLGFMEEARGLARLHEIKQEIYGKSKQGAPGGWGLKQTANLTNRSTGAVHENLELAQFAAAMPEAFEGVKTKKEAKAVMGKIMDNARRMTVLADLKEKEEKEDDLSLIEKQIQKFSSRIICDKMENALSSLDKTFDIVIFDPPWGVSLDQVSRQSLVYTLLEKVGFTVNWLPLIWYKQGSHNFSQETYEDSPENFVFNLESWLKLIYDRMSENSHLYFFFGIVNHATRNSEIWPSRSYEPIAFARKGSKKLVKLGAPDIIITPQPKPSMKKIHPSAKHPMIYLELLQRSAFPGDKVLDPMAGSGMLGVAAEVLALTHKLDWLEIEEKQTYRALALDNVIKGFYAITQQEESLEGE